ncbi:FAR1-related sequence 5-like protein [Tanacetum coccineum]
MRAREKRNKPPNQAQQRKLYCNYLKNMEGYTLKKLKGFKFEVIKDMFDKSFKRVHTFVDYKTELVEGSEKRAEDSSKRAGDELEQEPTKKQKVDDDKEREDLQQCFEFVTEEDVAIDDIPLATKHVPIVNFQIHRKGRNGYYEIMRADGSAKTYLLFSQLLKEFDREDLETLWKLVKAKHGNTRPEEGYERVLWGDLKTIKVGRVVLRLFDLVRTGLIVAGPMDGVTDYANTGTIRLRRDQRVLAMVDGLPSLCVADCHTGNIPEDDLCHSKLFEDLIVYFSFAEVIMSFFHGNNSTENDEFSGYVSAFYTEQVFNSHEDLKTWAQNKARPLGYVIITKRTKANTSGFTYEIDLKCDLSGEYKEKESSKDTATRKTNCPFMLVGKYSWVYNGWVLSVICDEHNHPPAQHMEAHPYARRLITHEYRLVEDLTRKNVAARKILAIIKEQNKDNVSTIKDIYNAQSKIRKAEKVGQTTMQNLMSLLHFNGYVHDYDTHPVTNELEALFFVHPSSFKIWRAFPHVLIMDATYKTNIYKMPFVEIVGITSTSKTFCIAFAFISEEKEKNYEWVLERLKLTLEGCMLPRVIITDRELALIGACKKVFPNATRLLCRWHIYRNIIKHCKPMIKVQCDWESFYSTWKLLEDSPTWISYLENYKQLQLVLRKYPRALSYVDEQWLNKYKEMFVSAWTDQSLNFGNHTSNRAESQHAKLKLYLQSTTYTLDQFVGFIDQIVQSQVTEINASFGRSTTYRYHQHNLPIFTLLRSHVSKEALDLILKELLRLDDPEFDYSMCGCRLREYIPLDSIDIFWRTLNVPWSEPVENEDIQCDDVLHLFKEKFNEQSNVVKKSLLRKLLDIVNPSKTVIKEPPIKKNTRGRPSLKKQQEKKRAGPKTQDLGKRSYSCRFFDIDPNMQPTRHSSVSNFQTGRTSNLIPDLNEEPPRHGSFVSQTSMWRDSSIDEQIEIERLRKQILKVVHPYVSVSGIQNVGSDGNYGFRAVALDLGLPEDHWPRIRSDLVRELEARQRQYTYIFGTISYQKIYSTVKFAGRWMEMPNTGLVIASTYNKVVINLSDVGGCNTSFPLWSRPPQTESHETIVVAHVDGNHYISVALGEGFPLLLTHPLWITYRSDVASGWEDKFVSRQNEFREYYYRTPESYDLT